MKHKTLEILTRLDFYAFLNYHFFRAFLNSLAACANIGVCILFYLNNIASPNRIELDSPFL